MKNPRKCHNHKTQPSKRSRDEEQIRTKHTPHMKLQAHKIKLQHRNRLGTVIRKTTVCVCTCGGGGMLNHFYSRETSPRILMQLQNTNICLPSIRVFYRICELSQLTHIIKNHMMKQSKVLDGDMKPEHKNKRTAISQTTNIDSQAPAIWNWLRRELSFSLK